MKKKLALLIYGPPREIELIYSLIPKMCGNVDYDVFIILREVAKNSKNRQGLMEKSFDTDRLNRNKENTFFVKLPPVDSKYIKEKIICPTGPDQREPLWAGMFYGIFLGVQYIKSTGKKYDYVIKTRTDYYPEYFPWFDGYLKKYLANGKKIIIDGTATMNWRYPDNSYLPWQGSVSDQFSFSSYDQFLDLWDFENNFKSFWTGVPETTLYRSIFYKYNRDHLQSPRRNQTFLSKYFFWNKNNYKLPMNIIYQNILDDDFRKKLLAKSKKKINYRSLHILIKKKLLESWGQKKDPILNDFQKKILHEKKTS